MLSSISVPDCGAVQTVSLPPISSARSRMPWSPKWPARPSAVRNFGVDALAIIADPQSKLSLIIAQFHFNLLRLGMS